jgi:hypothetical protein
MLDFDWIRQFGTATGEGVDAITVEAGNVFVAGYTVGTLPGQSSAGGSDVFVRSYDLGGVENWTRQFGSDGFDRSRAVGADGSGMYVAGFIGSALPGQVGAGGFDAFVRKYDFVGNELWTRQFGTSADDFANALVASDGAIYVAGSTDGTLPGQTPAGGSNDAFVRKYDSAGNELWTRQFGTSGSDPANAIAADPTGVYVAGSTTGSLSGQTSGGEFDGFVRKYDFEGSEIWTSQFEGTAPSRVRVFGASVAGGGLYVAGNISGGSFAGQTEVGLTDGFVRRYDPSGAALWTRQFGTPAQEDVSSVSADGTWVRVAGSTLGSFSGQNSSGFEDAFIHSYDVNGAEAGTFQFGTASFDAASSVFAQLSDVYVGGATGGALPGQTHAGDVDAFVVNLIEDGGDGFDTVLAGITAQVEDLVSAGVLNHGQGHSLINKLPISLQRFDRGEINGAVANLRAFINEVNALVRAGALAPSQADPLVDGASLLIKLLTGAFGED